jgi:tetratricopeptide (TPR) repeat protein
MSKSAIRTELLLALVAAASLVTGTAHAQRPNQGDDESAALIDEGRTALKNNKLDAAAKALDQAIALNPRRVDAYVLRSAVYAARKEYKQGIELMRRAQALAPTDEEVLTALGSQLTLSGDVTAGVPLLVQVTAKNAGRYDAQLLLGHHYHRSSKWPDSINAFEAYFKYRPAALANEDPRHRIDLADAYLRFHQPRKALPLFEQSQREYRAKKKEDLRSAIGVAWATAAIDCKKARPLLEKLEPFAKDHPEVWLVDGQCALALGNVASALELGRRYLDRSPKSTAAGHALVGEAYAARGNLPEAKKELEMAHQLEPARRRWPVRLAFVLRRNGDLKGSLEALEKVGAPDKPALDPDWYSELGETLLAKGEAASAVTRLTPVLPELPADAPVRVVLGAAQISTGQAELAIKTLADAEGIQSSPRSKKLLVEALSRVGADKLRANDAAGAEALLTKADSIEGTPMVWRNLGVARLALDKPTEAITVLDRASKAEPLSITLMLLGRARALTGDVAGARANYDKALAGEKGDNAVEVAIDWAASELLAGGDPAVAVAALEKTAAFGKGSARHKAALAKARHAAGIAALRAGNGAKAVELLKAASKDEPNMLLTRCDLAIASVAANDPNAITALKGITGQSCPFPPPADTQAAPILVAFTEGIRDPRRASKALDRLTTLGGKSTGPAAVLLGTSIRVVALEAARDAFNTGQWSAARRFLLQARNANARVGNDEVAHNLAAVDLAEGKVDLAIAQLEKLAGKLPEALLNLGIAYDKKSEPQKALDAWRRAKRAGARHPNLNDWIEAKERIYGP